MGTSRSSLAGALALALVGTSAVSVAAQPEPEVATGPEFASVAYVTESSCTQSWAQSRYGAGTGYEWLRDLPYGCDLEASDPRVSGKLTGVFGDDCFGDPDRTCVSWNTEEITNADGSWTGWAWGTDRPQDPEDPQAGYVGTLLKVFTGHGAYEGLTLILHGQGPLEGQIDFHGLIYEGSPPPPLGELPFPVPAE